MILRRLLRAGLAAALSVALCAAADPTEEEADSGDPDYAGGRRAVEARDWQAAIRLFSSART